MTTALVNVGVLLLLGLRISVFLAAKGGFGKKWQLWMLDEPPNGNPPKADDIVM